MSATMVGRRQKTLELHWLKRPKRIPKRRNLDQKINDSKSHIWRICLNFRFSSRKAQSQQNLAKKITNFTSLLIKAYLLKLIKAYFRNTAKNLNHFINFPANMFLVGVKKKKIGTAAFLDTQELHSRSTWKAKYLYIPVYLHKKIFVPQYLTKDCR